MNRRDFLYLTSAFSLSGYPIFKDKKEKNADLYHEEVPWLEEVQQCEASPEQVIHLPSVLKDELGNDITSLEMWQHQRQMIRQRWLDYLGPLEPNSNLPELTVLEEDELPGVVRQLVEYEGEPGHTVRGYLIKPKYIKQPRPGVLTLHTTTDDTIRQPAGVKGEPEKAFGLKLAQMGFVTFSPENFLWQDKGDRTWEEQSQRFLKRYPGSTGMAKMLFDASRGVDLLESLPFVDKKRLGAIGHSLGGKEVLYLAAFDNRIKATVSSEGGVGIDFSNWDDSWYLGQQIHNFGHKHHEVLALAAPNPFLLIGGDSADGERSCTYIQEVIKVYSLYGDPKRLGLLNHRQGHSVPPIAELRAYQWLLNYL